MIRSQCSLCRGRLLEEVMALPATPLANEFVKKVSIGKEQEKFPLRLVMCRSCLHVQIGDIVDPYRLFGDYVYVSGTSPVTISHLKSQAAEILRRYTDYKDREKLFVVEVGSNDGSLLKEFKNLGVGRILGVDPATKIAEKANEDGIPTIRDFFTTETAEAIVSDHRRADIVVANNVLAHAPDVRSIVEGVKKLLYPGGLFVFEVAHLLDVVDHMAFDTIYHEHFSYHTILPLIRMFVDMGMKVVSVDRNENQVGRGSLRVWVRNEEPSTNYVPTQITKLVDIEKKAGLYEHGFYRFLGDKIVYRGAELKRHLDLLLTHGRIIGFGAPAKLTTLMYAFGLGPRYTDAIYEDAFMKVGLFTPGHHIPVYHSDGLAVDAAKDPPSALVIWAWNFADSVIQRYKGLAAKLGMRIVTPLPQYVELQTGIGKGYLHDA